MQFYSKSSIKPPPPGPGGELSHKAEVGGALNRDGGLFEGRVYLI